MNIPILFFDASGKIFIDVYVKVFIYMIVLYVAIGYFFLQQRCSHDHSVTIPA